MNIKKLFFVSLLFVGGQLFSAEDARIELQARVLDAISSNNLEMFREILQENAPNHVFLSQRISLELEAFNHIHGRDKFILEGNQFDSQYDPEMLALCDMVILKKDLAWVNAVKEIFPQIDFSEVSFNAEYWAYERFIKDCNREQLAFLDACEIKWKGDDGNFATTCLHRAVNELRPQVVEFLLNNGAFVDPHDENFRTPLQALCLNNHQMWRLNPLVKPLVKLLVYNGAQSGEDPIFVANLHEDLDAAGEYGFTHYLIRLAEEREVPGKSRRIV